MPPSELKSAAAERARHEAAPLVAGLIFTADSTGVLIGRRAGADRLRQAKRTVGRRALLGERDRVTFLAGRRWIFVDLVENDDPLRPRSEISRAVRSDKVDRAAAILLMRNRAAPGERRDCVADNGGRLDRRLDALFRKRFCSALRRLDEQDGRRICRHEKKRDVDVELGLHDLRAGHYRDDRRVRLGDSGKRSERYRL
ncbi:MAG TPA: hypothetical protein VNX29_05370 [Kaistia sp.]|nr:hypothetical protein [Kaistia sp.]